MWYVNSKYPSQQLFICERLISKLVRKQNPCSIITFGRQLAWNAKFYFVRKTYFTVLYYSFELCFLVDGRVIVRACLLAAGEERGHVNISSVFALSFPFISSSARLCFFLSANLLFLLSIFSFLKMTHKVWFVTYQELKQIKQKAV